MEKNRVLIVEDNFMNMKLVRSLLQLAHFEVIEAGDAEKGIELARAHLPDLILMDIQLPGMDGLAATRQIKQDPNLKHIPVVALTSHAMRGDDVKAREAGCDGYITKPIDTRKFVNDLLGYLKSEPEVMKTQEVKSNSFKPRILIVDDEPMNIKLMNAILSSEPYEILQACDGKTALAKINENKVDIVLLDIMMPGMDGYEVTSKLKNDPQTRHIPIILVSALNSRENKLRGLELGADEFLTKPVNKIEILSRIKSMLRLRQYHEQLNARLKSEEALTIPKFERNNVSQKPSAGQKVLLVEDDEKDIKLFETITYGQPYDFIVARCGEEAVRIAQQEKIDLILLDILLPGINGYQVCEELKGNEKTRNIQIVMISCLSDLESKIKGVEQGVDDFLVKPIDNRQIKSRINALLKKKLYLDQLHYHNEKALDLAIIDGLTGLYNQSYFKRYLELEVQRSVQQGYQVALIMTDLDNFKKINDTFGHPTGDAVLQEFTRIIKANIREMDLPARYGGEEFVVVVPYADSQIAVGIAEKVRMATCNHGFTDAIPSAWGKITASFGIAFCPSDASNVNDLIEKADFMLYRAKRGGKNRVCTFE